MNSKKCKLLLLAIKKKNYIELPSPKKKVKKNKRKQSETTAFRHWTPDSTELRSLK